MKPIKSENPFLVCLIENVEGNKIQRDEKPTKPYFELQKYC